MNLSYDTSQRDSSVDIEGNGCKYVMLILPRFYDLTICRGFDFQLQRLAFNQLLNSKISQSHFCHGYQNIDYYNKY